MKYKNKPLYVDRIARKHKGKLYETFLLRNSFRQNGKVKHETVANLSALPRDIIELIRRAIKGETYVSADAAMEIVRSLPHGHVAAVLGNLRQLGLEKAIAAQKSRERSLAAALIVARLIEPQSKLATARGLNGETASSSLGEALGVADATDDELYAAMDWLLQRQNRIEKKLASEKLHEGTLVLYDLTSTWVTGRHCPLARLGHSRDNRPGTLQIEFGLLCAPDGCPVAVEVFEGNTGDPATVASQIAKLRERFDLRRIVFVGDRGMLTSARIREDLSPLEGLSWITALRHADIKKLAEKVTLRRSLFDDRELVEISGCSDFPGERLIACFNPLLAAERERKRAELLEATERRLEKVVASTRRAFRPLRGQDKIARRVEKALARHKMNKHFIIDIADDSLTYKRDEEKIAFESSLDGIYVVRTDVPRAEMSPAATVRNYKRLAVVERAFRSLKTVDLHVRPIHHRLANRVRAHVFICMLAYYVEWHMRQRLAPMLFDDEDKESAEEARSSPVSPARRSPRAQAKASRQRDAADRPVHSFQTLLSDLGTLTKNVVRTSFPAAECHTFEQYTLMTPVQRRAFALLDVSPNIRS
jgi:transposase